MHNRDQMPRTDSARTGGAESGGGVGLLRRTALGIWDTFLRDNRVVPPVLAVVALLIFSWVIASTFIGDDAEDQPVSNRQEIAQTPDESAAPAPEIENPNSDSYAAYQSKDPFRQLFQTPEADDGSGTDDGGTDDGGDGSDSGSPDEGSDDGSDGSQDDGSDGSGSGDAGNGDGENGSGGDGDSGNGNAGDGNNDDRPRTDQTTDPDSPASNQYDQDETTNRDPNPGNGGNNSSSDDDLFDSGGDLLPPPR